LFFNAEYIDIHKILFHLLLVCHADSNRFIIH